MACPEGTNDQAIELVERVSRCLLQEGKTKDNAAAVKQLASYIVYFSNSTELNIKQNDIFNNILDMVNSSSEKLGLEEVINKFNKEVEKAKNSLRNGKKNAKYKQFMKMIEENLSDDDDVDEEIKTVTESVNTIDPITKLPIVEPVKNVKCGHIYGKESILQLIANNSRTRCPIPGCSAADFVKKSDLVPDNALKRLLTQTNALQKNT